MTHQTSAAKRLTTTNNTTVNTLVNNNLQQCSAILQSGKRKGEVCNARMVNQESTMCNRHSKNKNKVEVPTLSS